jgi:hypothetical protein
MSAACRSLNSRRQDLDEARSSSPTRDVIRENPRIPNCKWNVAQGIQASPLKLDV